MLMHHGSRLFLASHLRAPQAAGYGTAPETDTVFRDAAAVASGQAIPTLVLMGSDLVRMSRVRAASACAPTNGHEPMLQGRVNSPRPKSRASRADGAGPVQMTDPLLSAMTIGHRPSNFRDWQVAWRAFLLEFRSTIRVRASARSTCAPVAGGLTPALRGHV